MPIPHRFRSMAFDGAAEEVRMRSGAEGLTGQGDTRETPDDIVEVMRMASLDDSVKTNVERAMEALRALELVVLRKENRILKDRIAVLERQGVEHACSEGMRTMGKRAAEFKGGADCQGQEHGIDGGQGRGDQRSSGGGRGFAPGESKEDRRSGEAGL